MPRESRDKPTLPFGTRVRLTTAWSGFEGVVTVKDHLGSADGREYFWVYPLHEDRTPPDDDCVQPQRCAVDELEVIPPLHKAFRKLIQVGARVLVRLPYGTFEAHVTEDRGRVLQGDSQVVRVRAVEQTYYVNEFEIPTDFLEVLPPRPRPRGKSKRPSLR